MGQGPAEAVEGPQRRSVHHHPVHGEEVLLELDHIACDRRDLLHDRAHALRAIAKGQVPPLATYASNFLGYADQNDLPSL